MTRIWLPFTVDDLPSALTFYRDRLGLPVVDGWRRDGEEGVVLAAESGFVELVSPAEPRPAPIAFEVPDVDAVYARMPDAAPPHRYPRGALRVRGARAGRRHRHGLERAVTLEFTLPPALEAHEPPEARGLGRDGVRLLVSSSEGVGHHRFTDLPTLLRAGDVLVVNTSATMPAAVPVPDSHLTVHFSTEQPTGTWLVELRNATAKSPFTQGHAGARYPLLGGGSVTLLNPFSAGRLWESEVDTQQRTVPEYLASFGAPIRYSYVGSTWPISYYQTVFGVTPGSAEMPSASRPFTDHIVTQLVARGVQFAPILLHTGVASPEAHERPYPERFAVPPHDQGPRTAGACGEETGDSRRNHSRPGHRERRRRRLDRRDHHAGTGSAARGRPADRLPRAEGVTPGHARRHRRP